MDQWFGNSVPLVNIMLNLGNFIYDVFHSNTVLVWKLLTHEQLEMHGCLFSTVATDALVLKHQAISIHSVD